MIRQKIEQRPKEMIHEPVIVWEISTPHPEVLQSSRSGWPMRCENHPVEPGMDGTPTIELAQVDFILSRELDAITGKVDFLTTKEGRPASDHWPIRAVLRAPRRPY